MTPIAPAGAAAAGRSPPKGLLAAMAAALIVGTGCANAPQGGMAIAEAPAPPSELAQLEDIFWNCDYVATTRGMDATPAAQCYAATRELRRVKFAGSFNQMLAWWREMKPAEHEKRRRARGDPRL